MTPFDVFVKAGTMQLATGIEAVGAAVIAFAVLITVLRSALNVILCFESGHAVRNPLAAPRRP